MISKYFTWITAALFAVVLLAPGAYIPYVQRYIPKETVTVVEPRSIEEVLHTYPELVVKP